MEPLYIVSGSLETNLKSFILCPPMNFLKSGATMKV